MEKSPNTYVGPVAPPERIQVLDILRGLALFGIIAANMRAFNTPMPAYFDVSLMWNQGLDRVVQALINTFISGKFITLFSFLFGIGFAVQVGRAEAKGARPGSFYPRRLLILMLLGLAHGFLLWSGDILAPYALYGFLLLLFRKRRQKTVLIWAAACYVWPLFMSLLLLAATSAGVRMPMPPPATPADLERTIAAYSTGSYAQMFSERLKELAMLWAGVVFYYPRVFGIFLLGLYTWRSGVIQNLSAHVPRLRAWRLWGLVIGLAGNAVWVTIYQIWHLNPFKPSPLGVIADLASGAGVPALSLCYASTVALLALRSDWVKRLEPFAAVGRTALSNYLMQTVLCTTLYNNWGFGLYGAVGPALGLVPTVLIYGCQVVLSQWWVRRFLFGPMEWFWRTLTYGRRQPMLVTVEPVSA